MRVKSIALALVMSCLGTIAACARASSAGSAATPVPATTVHVINDGRSDMEVYVAGAPAGPQTRLGTVPANSMADMIIPDRVMWMNSTPLKFLADPVGRKRTSVSSSIVVTRGDVVTLRIPPG